MEPRGPGIELECPPMVLQLPIEPGELHACLRVAAAGHFPLQGFDTPEFLDSLADVSVLLFPIGDVQARLQIADGPGKVPEEEAAVCEVHAVLRGLPVRRVLMMAPLEEAKGRFHLLQIESDLAGCEEDGIIPAPVEETPGGLPECLPVQGAFVVPDRKGGPDKDDRCPEGGMTTSTPGNSGFI